MKRIHELTEAELLELTHEQIEKHIDYECALEGVPLLPPHPGPAPVNTAPPLDLKVYEVGGVMVTDAEYAGRILDVLTSGNIFKVEYNKEHLVQLKESDYNYPEIKTKTVRSMAQWEAIKADMAAYETAKKEYDRHARVYNDAVKDRKNITEQIYNTIRDAQDHAYDRDCLRAEFARYLDLAEGNRRVALNFLEKVKDLSDFPELRDEFCPVEDMAAPKAEAEEADSE